MNSTKKVKFIVEMGLTVHEIVEEFPDDITQEELNDYAEQIVWEYVSVTHHEVS